MLVGDNSLQWAVFQKLYTKAIPRWGIMKPRKPNTLKPLRKAWLDMLARQQHPEYFVDLPKSVRKGKTLEELQAMRKSMVEGGEA